MQTANALSKEASLHPLGDVQESFFYDWWCLLMSSRNFLAPNQGDNGASSAQNDQYKAFMNPQATEVLAQAPTTAPAPIAVRPPPKGKAKGRKSLAQGKPKKKGLPILVPGVAPLVVQRNLGSGGQQPAGNTGRVSSKNIQSLKRAQSPGTPHWDNNQSLSDSARAQQTPVVMPQMPQIAEQTTSLGLHSAGMTKQHTSPQVADVHSEQTDPQFIQHQQLLQQQQFLLLQHGNNLSNTPGMGPAPGMPVSVGGSIAVNGMMVHNPDAMGAMGNANEPHFLEDMMGSGMYVNNGLNFPPDAQMNGLGFDAVALRPMSTEYQANGEIYAAQTGLKEDFDGRGDHAGMNNPAVISDNFMNVNFGFDINAPMQLAPEQNTIGLEGPASFRMGQNYGFNGDAGGNGEFFLEAPLTMTL